MTLRAFSARSTQSRAWKPKGEMGFQHDAQDFMGFVQRGHLVTDSQLVGRPGLVVVRSEQSHAGFLGGGGGVNG